MANPNIVAVASIVGVTNVALSVATGGGFIIGSVPTGHVYKVNSLTVSNKTASNCTVQVYLTRSAVNYYFCYNVVIPANSVLSVIGKDMQIYLNEADQLGVAAGTAASLDAFASYEDIS